MKKNYVNMSDFYDLAVMFSELPRKKKIAVGEELYILSGEGKYMDDAHLEEYIWLTAIDWGVLTGMYEAIVNESQKY